MSPITKCTLYTERQMGG